MCVCVCENIKHKRNSKTLEMFVKTWTQWKKRKKINRMNLQAKTKISKYYLLFMNTLQMLCIREWKWSEKNRHVYTHIYRIKLIYLPFLWGIYSSHNNFSLFQHEIFIITSLERCFIFFLLYICLPLYFLRFIVFIFRRFFPSS